MKDGDKIFRLFAVTILDYRGPVGDYAWEKIGEVMGQENSTALAFITGFVMGTNRIGDAMARWQQLIDEAKL